jgi:hypothetical protein
LVARPFQNAVVIEWLGPNKSNKSTTSTYIDETQSTAKEEMTYSGSGAGNPLLVPRSIARQVTSR